MSNTKNALVEVQSNAGAVQTQTAAAAMMEQTKAIREMMRGALIRGIDYGVIPGTGKDAKPTLLKPGAEKLCFAFRLRPHTESEKQIDAEGHLTVWTRVVIHSQDGTYLGDGEGVCSTRETKYAFKRANVKCPKCGKETVIKGKQEYGGGWVCLSSKGGCGAKFSDKA